MEEERDTQGTEVSLREVEPGDLPLFFAQQLDPQANYMAAFVAENPADRQAFDRKWEHILNDEAITVRTILVDGRVAGEISTFTMFDQFQVSYWLDRAFWGMGAATQALKQFLALVDRRPVYGRAAKDNAASIRVLEKCGFRLIGEERAYANGRGQEIDEVILRLDS